MNERFFALPPERQSAIINAGFRVFAANDYRHAPMSAIADAAGISKPLLFHYFGNKEGLYRFLWDTATSTTARITAEFGVRDTANPFELFRRTTSAKCSAMVTYPHLFAFSTRAYYETEPKIAHLIQQEIAGYSQRGQELFEQLCDPGYLADDISLADLYRDFLMLSDGYMLQNYRRDSFDAATIQADFFQIIDRWERIFGRKEHHA